MDIKELLDGYSDAVKIRREGDGVFVALPFYHIESDESIALRFTETEDGRPIISDCGTTMDYLEITGVNIKYFREKLNSIKERFFIEEEKGVFYTVMPTDSPNQVRRHLGYFIQAISIIANIDL